MPVSSKSKTDDKEGWHGRENILCGLFRIVVKADVMTWLWIAVPSRIKLT
jgi:hypothetical protein